MVSRDHTALFFSRNLKVLLSKSCKIDHVAELLQLYCSIKKILAHKQTDNYHLQPCVAQPMYVPQLVVIIYGCINEWLADRKRIGILVLAQQ